MGLLNRIKGGPSIRELASEAMDIGKEAVTDRDKLNELQYKLATIQAQSMLGGPGQSITKITICGLVSLVVGVGAYMLLRVVEFLLASGFTPESIESAKVLMGFYGAFALPASTIIGILTGGFVTGTSFKRSKWSKNE